MVVLWLRVFFFLVMYFYSFGLESFSVGFLIVIKFVICTGGFFLRG